MSFLGKLSSLNQGTNQRSLRIDKVYVVPRHFPSRHNVICGGSLISSKWVLTAGHCGGAPRPTTPSRRGVILGAHNWAEEDRLVIRPVSKMVRHPDYRGPVDNYDNDLALLQLQTEVSWKIFPNVRPICLPSADKKWEWEGMRALTTGWGDDGHRDLGSPFLKKLEVEILETKSQYCEVNRSPEHENYAEDEICVHSVKRGGNQSVCHGDSGGPLMVKVGQNYKLLGVLSYGAARLEASRCRLDLPSYFFRVDRVLEWVSSNIRQTETCPAASSLPNPGSYDSIYKVVGKIFKEVGEWLLGDQKKQSI